MIAVNGRLFFADEGGQPQSGQKAALVRSVGQRAQPMGEFSVVGFEPIADLCFPAIVDLKEVSGFEQCPAPLQVLQN